MVDALIMYIAICLKKQFDQDLFKAEIISIERNIEKMKKKENDELVRIIFL